MAIITNVINKFLNKRRYQQYRFFFDMPEGRTILTDMSRAHGVFSSAFDPDPIELARMAGERNVVLRIMTILNLTSEEVADLDRED